MYITCILFDILTLLLGGSMIKKIAMYCRVSTDDQAEHGYSLKQQKNSIEKYLSLYEEEFPEERIEYIDHGFSAKDLDRREMQNGKKVYQIIHLSQHSR